MHSSASFNRRSRTSGDVPDASQAGPGPSSLALRSLESNCPPDLCMDQIVDKLKLLNYERDFCKPKRHLKLLSRTYFCLPAPLNGQNEQFYYFTSLVAWLLTLSGQPFQPPQQYDDPNLTCTNILSELRQAGFAPATFPPTKLRQGHGEAVCGVLNALCDLAMEKTSFSFSAPTYLPETCLQEADVDDEAEVTADEIADPVEAASSDEEEMYIPQTDTQAASTAADLEPSAPQVDPAEWRLEVERVAPRLKITVTSNARDWRSHLDEAHKHSAEIDSIWPAAQAALNATQTEVSSALDKLSTRERFLNSQCQHLTAEYAEAKELMSRLQAQYNKKQDAVNEQDMELGQILKDLEDRKSEVDARGSNISDSTPVVRIKGAIKGIRTEVQQMSVRIGVLQHQLTQVQLAKFRSRLTSD